MNFQNQKSEKVDVDAHREHNSAPAAFTGGLVKFQKRGTSKTGGRGKGVIRYRRGRSDPFIHYVYFHDFNTEKLEEADCNFPETTWQYWKQGKL